MEISLLTSTDTQFNQPFLLSPLFSTPNTHSICEWVFQVDATDIPKL